MTTRELHHLPSSTFTETFEKIFSGEIEPPHLSNLGLEDGLGIIASHELRPTGVGCIMLGSNRILPGLKSHRARYFLEDTQAGTFTGSGYIAFSEGNGYGEFASFAICLHKKVLDPQANLLRGWSPAHCKKCGLDMTVDSGD